MATRLENIEFELSRLQRGYDKAQGQLQLLESQHTEKSESLRLASDDLRLWGDVQILFSKCSEFAREQLKKLIEDTVTAALQAVFERDDISFAVEIKSRGNVPEAVWQVVTVFEDARFAGSPEDSHGGGISDVVSLALRLAVLELSRPKPHGPLLLDEVGKHVSRNYGPNLAAFLKQYAAKTDRQIIYITHDTNLSEVADVGYVVGCVNGKSGVSQI